MPDIPTRRWAYPQDNLFHDGVAAQIGFDEAPIGAP
jgi:hypothetical protein